jgi:hypothetical protein
MKSEADVRDWMQSWHESLSTNPPASPESLARAEGYMLALAAVLDDQLEKLRARAALERAKRAVA